MDHVEQAVGLGVGDVEDLSGRGLRAGRGQDVGAHDVRDIGEIAGLLAVPVHVQRHAQVGLLHELGDDGRVQGLRVLARAEDVEVAQGDGLQAEGLGPDDGVVLGGELRDGVGRHRLGPHVLALREDLAGAVSGAGGGVDEALDLGIAGRDQQVQGPRHVGLVGGQRAVHGLGHGTDGGLMEDVGDALASARAVRGAGDVALQELDAPPHGGQLSEVAGGEVVDDAHLLPATDQLFADMGADEAGPSGDEPISLFHLRSDSSISPVSRMFR